MIRNAMRTARVIARHQPESSDSLVLYKGEVVMGRTKKTEWDGWLWCTNSAGVSAWVPSNYLQQHEERTDFYEVLVAYNSFELEVDVDEFVEIMFEESGWAMIKTATSKQGWVPKDNLIYI